MTILLSTVPASFADDAPGVSAASAIVMHSGGEVIYEKNADERSLIASTTKIMTAIVAMENLELDKVIEIKPEFCGIEGSTMYLAPGQRYTVRELLLGLLLESGNDAAVALAVSAGGSEARFVRMMNRKAMQLGMYGTSFANPHGLDDAKHYSTARDLAYLMDYCMRNDDFAKLVGTKSCNVGKFTFCNHNRLLMICQGCIGGKTGFTEAAGRCLVSVCERNQTRYICVTLSDPNDWDDHINLYNWAFSEYSLRNVLDGVEFDVPVLSGTKKVVKASAPDGLYLFVPNSEELVLTAELPRFAFAPLEQGDTAGRISVSMNGRVLAMCELVFTESIPAAASVSMLL